MAVGGLTPAPAFQRGDVWLVQAPLPDRTAGQGTRSVSKLVVLLHGERDYSVGDVPAVVASTDRRPGSSLAYEIRVGIAEGFDHATVIDGRWVFLLQKAEVLAGRFITHLDDDTMDAIAEAIVIGLQL